MIVLMFLSLRAVPSDRAICVVCMYLRYPFVTVKENDENNDNRSMLGGYN